MLSKAARQELEARADWHGKCREAILLILAEEGSSKGPAATEQETVPIGGNGYLAGLGIREAARKVLEGAPRGMRPMAVAEKMEELGFQSGAEVTTPLVTRVRNEMWRMAKKGDLRSNRGTYSIRRDVT